MIERYSDPVQTYIWSTKNKLKLWQDVELAVIQARVMAGLVSREDFDEISHNLTLLPVDIALWEKLELEMSHDLNAFVKERQLKLRESLRKLFHHQITSYDTEEPAFALILLEAIQHILGRNCLSKKLWQSKMVPQLAH